MKPLFGYVARDLDFRVFLYMAKPIRRDSYYLPLTGDKQDAIELPKGSFPKLSFYHEPIEVNVIIKPVRKKSKKWFGVVGR